MNPKDIDQETVEEIIKALNNWFGSERMKDITKFLKERYLR